MNLRPYKYKTALSSNIHAPFNSFGVCKWSMFNDLPSYLMPQNTRAGKWNFTFHNMEIRVAHSTGYIQTETISDTHLQQHKQGCQASRKL